MHIKISKDGWESVIAFIVVLACIVLMCMTAGCKGMEKIEYITHTEYVHDTTEIYTHDTTRVTEVRIDSVDRYVEKTVYVDSNGVVHEKEIERLTRYIDESREAYRSYEHILQQRIDSLKEQLAKKTETKVETVKVYVWWPCWVVLGIAALLGLWWLAEHVINNLAKKEGEA